MNDFAVVRVNGAVDLVFNILRGACRFRFSQSRNTFCVAVFRGLASGGEEKTIEKEGEEVKVCARCAP